MNNLQSVPALENNRALLGVSTGKHMLGVACFGLSVRSYTAQNLQKCASSLAVPRTICQPRTLQVDQCGLSIIKDPSQLSSISVERFQHHSRSCLLAGKGGFGATIWHALLPSCHFSDRECLLSSTRQLNKAIFQRITRNGLISSSELLCNSSSFYDSYQGRLNPSHQILRNLSIKSQRSFGDHLGLHGRCSSTRSRLSAAAGLSEGSWNVTWDVRPARWLHGRHSAWLLFGMCACFASPDPANTEAILEEDSDGMEDVSLAGNIPHGKKVYTNYSVTGIPGDGRCLFRAVAHGACLRTGKPSPDEKQQRELADELRASVADEFLKRRKETEWFVEGDFDTYVKQIRKPHVWGGEPELLMASHVLQMPITVYMNARNSDGLIAIAEYGQEYGKENPIRVLYHGFGHYDALQVPTDGAQSKL
eukprot:Gb_28852 [translate_table: standard]